MIVCNEGIGIQVHVGLYFRQTVATESSVYLMREKPYSIYLVYSFLHLGFLSGDLFVSFMIFRFILVLKYILRHRDTGSIVYSKYGP